MTIDGSNRIFKSSAHHWPQSEDVSDVKADEKAG